MSGLSRLNGAAAALMAVTASVACTSEDLADPPAEFIAVRRAWLPGERDSLIQAIIANRLLTFPYFGDISDQAPVIYDDPDSVVVMVLNPDFNPSPSVTEMSIAELTRFGTGWNFIAGKITMINQSQTPPDTLFWHSVMWSDPANDGDHGFAIAFSRSNTFNINPVNTAAFDASFGKTGAAAGEFHLTTLTYWEDDAKGGRYQVTSQVYPGGFTPITTGPYLGGQMRSGTQFGRVHNAKMEREVGSENPSNFTVSFDYRGAGLEAVEILCVFPSPCTSNVLTARGVPQR